MTAISYKIDAKQFLEFTRRAQLLTNTKVGLNVAGSFLKGKLANYPPARHGKQPFVSPRQQRFFFYALNAGIIDVPYSRGISSGSQKLGQSWQVEVNGLYAIIGTGVSYAPVVQGEDDQSRYHRITGWKTEAQVAAEDGPQAVRIVESYIAKDWQ